MLAVQIAIQGLTVQAGEARAQQAGASSLDVRVDAGSGLEPRQRSPTLGALPGVVQAVPLYEKQVTAGPVGSSLTGDTVTLVGLQDSSAALRSVSVVARTAPAAGEHHGGGHRPGVEHSPERRVSAPRSTSVRASR